MRDRTLYRPRCNKYKTSLVHVRGFEPPEPRRVAVLRTAAANRICLTCTSLAERAWIRTRDTRRCSRFQAEVPTNRSSFVGWSASAINLTRPSLQTGGSGASRTLTSRRTARFERGGLTKCPALPNKLAVMRGFEPLDPDLHRASDFPGQLFKPLTHITAKQNGGEYSIRTNDTY